VRSLLVVPLLSLVAACSLFVRLDELTDGSSGGLDGAVAQPPGLDASPAPNEASTPDPTPDAASPLADSGSSSYRDLVLSHAPLGYWRLGDRSGETAVDETGFEHPGLYYGGYELGVPGLRSGDTAARFNGSSACVYVGNFFQFANRVSFSVEAWIKPTSFDDGARIVSTEGPGGGIRRGWNLMYNSPGEPFFEGWLDDGSGESQYVIGVYSDQGAGGPIALGEWSHLVATFETTEESIWIDGELRGRFTQSTLSLPDEANFAIGCGGDGTGSITSGVHGDLAEIAVYDRVLSEQQIKAHHALGKSP